MIGTEVKVYQPDFHEDFRGDIWTNRDRDEYGDDREWRLISSLHHQEVY